MKRHLHLVLFLILAATAPGASAEPASPATVDALPRGILVIARFSPDMPPSLGSQLGRLLDTTVASLQQRLDGITVARRTKDMPLGVEGHAGCVVEVSATCEYASYARPGESDIAAMLNAAVPTALTVRLRSRQGRAFDLQLDRTIQAEQPAPETIKGLGTDGVAKENATRLLDDAIGKMTAALPAWDAAALRSQAATVPEAPLAQAPLIAISCRTTVGKENGKPNANVFAATGSSELYGELLQLIARRIGPVRLTEDKNAKVDATILIDNTVWYRSYGTRQGMIATNNGSLPYRAESVITLTAANGAPSHPWAGKHRYTASIELPEQVTRSGGFASESVRAVAALGDQLGEAIQTEIALAAAYRPATGDEVDQYLVQVIPIGRLDHPKVAQTTWCRSLPNKLQTALAARMAPARLVLPAQQTAGRVAGLVTVYADGELTSVHGLNNAKPTLEPTSLQLDVQISSAFSGKPHPWEGAHPLKLAIDRAEITKLMNRKGADPLDTVLTNALRAALQQ